MIKLHCGDAVSWLSGLAPESVDCCITDPPYESLEKWRATGTTTRLKQSKGSSNQWFSIFPNDRFPELLAEIYRVLKPNTHFYLFCDDPTMWVVKPMGEAAGFRYHKALVWSKEFLGMGYHYRAYHEFILFFSKGKRKLNDLSIPDVLKVRMVRGGYPTEKPVALLSILIRQSTQSGEIVMDPFMGSGSCGVAAVHLGRGFFGNDIAKDSFALTKKRIKVLTAEQ